MFRQVVLHRWVPGAGTVERTGYRAAMDALRAIPELVALRYGEDAGHFEDNHDFVAVLDFPDFAAARRYVAAEPHRHFVAEHASRVAEARVVVQHTWAVGEVAGLHHVKLPVTDVARSREWYSAAFGFLHDLEFTEDGVLRGVALRHADLRLALRHDPERARALAGFDTLCLAVGTGDDLAAVLHRLDSLGIAHTAPVSGHGGLAADVADPDGHLVRLHTLG